jgi:hypothetical protein
MTYPHVNYLGPAHPESSDPTAMRELKTRVNGGIQVSLLWCQRDGRVWVAVADTKTDQAFSLPVRDDERPLDVFHHPYAYAASHGIDTGVTSPPLDSDFRLAA